MKKSLACLTATLALTFSMNTVANDYLDDATKIRFEKEVATMTDYANLSPEQASKMMRLKVKLYTGNQKAMAQYGQESPKFREVRKANMQAFQRSLKTTITPQQLKTHRKHLAERRKKNQS